MLYASFGILVNDCRFWFILSYMWGFVFMIRMTIKDNSLWKKEGSRQYFEQSWLILPKWYGNTLLSVVIYSIVAIKSFMVYNYGIEGFVKMVLH